MEIRRKYLELKPNKRVIVVSDIHGNLDLFIKLLEKVNFTEEDYLFILGDIIEKGPKSLETLRYVMNLRGNVHCILGNCDDIYRDIMKDLDNDMLKRYALFRRESVINEMCEELHIKIDETSDLGMINEELRIAFNRELNWLSQLPHIIETGDFIFAHGGINPNDEEALNVMKNDKFMDKGYVFEKFLFLGHWPTCNYHKDIMNCNPIINYEQKIISIDGGTVIKDAGQLNGFIIDNNDFSYTYVDELPKYRVSTSQNIVNQKPININWMDSEVEIIKEEGEVKYCRHISSNHKLRIPSDWIYARNGKSYCNDCTNYYLSVEAQDQVGLITIAGDLALVKKAGIIGWINKNFIKISVSY